MAKAIPLADGALLAAQAKAGQAGVDAYEAAKSELSASKSNVLQGAMDSAASRGGPQGAMGSALAGAEDVYNQRQSSLTGAQAAYQDSMASRAGRAQDYQGAVQGARGLIADQAAQTVAPIRAQSDFQVNQIRQSGTNRVNEINAEGKFSTAKFEAESRARKQQYDLQLEQELAREERARQERMRQEAVSAARSSSSSSSSGPERQNITTVQQLEAMLADPTAAFGRAAIEQGSKLNSQSAQTVSDTRDQYQRAPKMSDFANLRRFGADEQTNAYNAAVDAWKEADPGLMPKPETVGIDQYDSQTSLSDTFQNWSTNPSVAVAPPRFGPGSQSLNMIDVLPSAEERTSSQNAYEDNLSSWNQQREDLIPDGLPSQSDLYQQGIGNLDPRIGNMLNQMSYDSGLDESAYMDRYMQDPEVLRLAEEQARDFLRQDYDFTDPLYSAAVDAAGNRENLNDILGRDSGVGDGAFRTDAIEKDEQERSRRQADAVAAADQAADEALDRETANLDAQDATRLRTMDSEFRANAGMSASALFGGGASIEDAYNFYLDYRYDTEDDQGTYYGIETAKEYAQRLFDENRADLFDESGTGDAKFNENRMTDMLITALGWNVGDPMVKEMTRIAMEPFTRLYD